VCHFVDALCFLAASLPVEAHAISTRDHQDAVSILLRFGDGSTGTIVYSSIGDPRVPKEYIEVFADGRVVQIEDFHRVVITTKGNSKASRGVQNKGQNGLVSAFLAAARGQREAPIPLDDLVAVTEATFAIEESLRIGAPAQVGSAR